MKLCTHEESGVRDSRKKNVEGVAKEDFDYSIRRRRICFDCGHKFTTYEITQEQMDSHIAKQLVELGTYKELIKGIKFFLCEKEAL